VTVDGVSAKPYFRGRAVCAIALTQLLRRRSAARSFGALASDVLDEGAQLGQDLTPIRAIEEDAGGRDGEGREQRLRPAAGNRRLFCSDTYFKSLLFCRGFRSLIHTTTVFSDRL
jgi:hypothetical protein